MNPCSLNIALMYVRPCLCMCASVSVKISAWVTTSMFSRLGWWKKTKVNEFISFQTMSSTVGNSLGFAFRSRAWIILFLFLSLWRACFNLWLLSRRNVRRPQLWFTSVTVTFMQNGRTTALFQNKKNRKGKMQTRPHLSRERYRDDMKEGFKMS